jgi:hypothetical protein
LVSERFPAGSQNRSPEFDFEFLELNGVQIEVVNADERMAPGAFRNFVSRPDRRAMIDEHTIVVKQKYGLPGDGAGHRNLMLLAAERRPGP